MSQTTIGVIMAAIRFGPEITRKALYGEGEDKELAVATKIEGIINVLYLMSKQQNILLRYIKYKFGDNGDDEAVQKFLTTYDSLIQKVMEDLTASYPTITGKNINE